MKLVAGAGCVTRKNVVFNQSSSSISYFFFTFFASEEAGGLSGSRAEFGDQSSSSS